MSMNKRQAASEVRNLRQYAQLARVADARENQWLERQRRMNAMGNVMRQRANQVNKRTNAIVEDLTTVEGQIMSLRNSLGILQRQLQSKQAIRARILGVYRRTRQLQQRMSRATQRYARLEQMAQMYKSRMGLLRELQKQKVANQAMQLPPRPPPRR